MAELKTAPTEASVDTYLAGVADEQRRTDCWTLAAMMSRITGAKPVMWGPSIVGFGQYHYRYASGCEGDWFLVGFAPRKQNLTVYIMAGSARYPELMAKLGKHKTGQSCLYLKRLADVDLVVLEELITSSVEYLRPR